MKCEKHQWDYIGNQRIGENPVVAYRNEFAVWICPYCKERNEIKTS